MAPRPRERRALNGRPAPTHALIPSIAAASAAGRSSTAFAPGSGAADSARTMEALSLLTGRRATRSTSSGAVQRPRKPGLRRSYTSLGFRVYGCKIFKVSGLKS
jgi:hypothetical protein